MISSTLIPKGSKCVRLFVIELEHPRGEVESNQTNFELIFFEFFELKMDFRINLIEKKMYIS